MINTKRPNTDDYTQVGFIEAKDNQGNYQNIDHIYDSEGNIVFQQGYLNEYDGADDFSIPAIGKPLIDYTIYGNTFQDGIPTPDNPIMPQGTGDRTGNLFDEGLLVDAKGIFLDGNVVADPNRTCTVNAIPVSDTSYVLSWISDNVLAITATYNNGNLVNRVASLTSPTVIDTTGATELRVVFYKTNVQITKNDVSNAMLNYGSTALPYEPYGYKISISSAGQTKNIYLGQVQTTRRIKKLVLTGDEDWAHDWNAFETSLNGAIPIGVDNVITVLSNCYEGYPDISAGVITGAPNGIVTKRKYYTAAAIKDERFTTAADFKSYLAAQYAAGTPVTVWYVLAEPETGIVNEPLAKIGDYADSVDFSQAGVEIPTLKKPSTTVIDVETSVEPSEVDVTYRGTTKPKYDLFLAKNGDSFEAKDGQSLYIGGNP